MAAKMCARRRAAFFGALRATGNQTLAAERARVSRSWVSKHRAEDPAFRAELEAALATAKGRLDRASGVGPDGAWRAQEGEELAVRGSNGRWTQVARARPKQWTPRVEARFLGALAASCNVKLACAQVGLSPASAYGHRKRWTAFAQRWDAAIEEGYDRLSTALVAHAGAMMGDVDLIPERDLGPVTVADVFQLLRLHRARATGEGRSPGRRPPPPRPLEEVEDSIRAKLAVFERARRAATTPEARAARQAILRGEGSPDESAPVPPPAPS